MGVAEPADSLRRQDVGSQHRELHGQVYARKPSDGGNFWGAICSVRVTLTFTNPLNPTGANNNPITITRTIAVMSKAGVNP